MSNEIKTVAILGVGLVGASLGAALKKRDSVSRVLGVGRSLRNLEIALKRGCVDEIGTDVAAAVAVADLVVLATPVDAFSQLLRVIAEEASRGCIVTDVGSVKRSVCEAVGNEGLAGRFVGGHPMAGGVDSGAEYADERLFEGRVTVLTPTVETPDHVRETVESMWRRVGAEILLLEPAEHDHVVAAASHLPQMVSVGLAAACAEHDRPEVFQRLAAGGFASTTRMAASDFAMWRAIVVANRDEIAAAMDGFSEVWSRLRKAVGRGDVAAVQAVMEAAAAFKESMKA